MPCALTFGNLKAENRQSELVLKHRPRAVEEQFSFTLCLLSSLLSSLLYPPAFSHLCVLYPSYSKHCRVGYKLLDMGEGREGGMGEGREGGMGEGREGGRVGGRGVVESGVGLHALSRQCGRVVGMEQGVGVVGVVVLGECGG